MKPLFWITGILYALTMLQMAQRETNNKFLDIIHATGND